MAFLFLLFLVQGIFLGVWAVVGDKPTPWRFVGVVAAIVALVCLQKVPGFDFLGQVERMAVPLLFVVVATSLSLFIGRMAGVRIEHVPRNASSNLAFQMVRLEESLEGTDSASTEPPKLQFSLWSLMSWTTAFAVLLCSFSTLRVVVPSGTFSAWSWLTVVVSIAVVSLVVLVALWVALGDRWLVARIVVLVLAILIIALIIALSGPGSRFLEVFIGVCVMAAVLAAVLIGSLSVLRLTGHRMVWRKPAVWSLFRGTRRRV